MGFHRVIIGIINLIFGLAEIILVIRVLLEFFGANKEAPFAAWIFNTSQSLLDPFRGIFPSAIIEGRYAIDFSALFAIVVYAIISYLITGLIEFLAHKEERY